jgi:hypothetical protein
MKRKSSRPKTAGKPPKYKHSFVNAAKARGGIHLRPKKTSGVRVTLTNAAAVGGVIPVNLKLGRNFGKSDKVLLSAECCGPYHQPGCAGYWHCGVMPG